MYIVYVITSEIRNYDYVGLTSNFPARFYRHNKGYERTTKPYRPFRILFTEEYKTRKEVRAREKFLKSGAGREYIKSRK